MIPNGIDTDVFRPGSDTRVRERLGLSSDIPLVGAVGNVRGSKAYDILLRGFASLRKHVPNAQLVIAGDTADPGFSELEGLRDTLRLGNSVRFVGFVEDVPEFLRSLDVFVLSSRDEGFSLTTVQAMASGVPVVATRCGGPEEILQDGVSGLLVPSNDPTALAGGMERLLRDRVMADEMGSRGRVIAGDTADPGFSELEGLRDTLRLGNSVRFVGFVEDVPEFLRSLDVFVLSSRDEGFSLTTVQAMASGVPVVATRCGGPEEILQDGVSGLLVPSNDPTALAGGMERLLRDRVMADEMGSRGRRRAEAAFSIDRMLASYSDLYDRVLGH